MKTVTKKRWWISLAVAGMIGSAVVGCGGGGGSDNETGVPEAEKVVLTKEAVSKVTGDLAGQIGCVYTEGTASRAPKVDKGQIAEGIAQVRTIINQHGIVSAAAPRETEETAGECGGTMVASGNGGSGYYAFDNYCTTQAGGVETTVNGRINMRGSQDTIVIETETPLHIQTTNPQTHEEVDVTIRLKHGTFKMAGGDMLSGGSVTAQELTITDNVQHRTMVLSNVSATYSDQGVTFSLAYSGPDVNGVTISGNIDKNGDGAVEMHGQNGSWGKWTGENRVYTVTSSDGDVGTLDCSMVDISQIQTF